MDKQANTFQFHPKQNETLLKIQYSACFPHFSWTILHNCLRTKPQTFFDAPPCLAIPPQSLSCGRKTKWRRIWSTGYKTVIRNFNSFILILNTTVMSGKSIDVHHASSSYSATVCMYDNRKSETCQMSKRNK